MHYFQHISYGQDVILLDHIITTAENYSKSTVITGIFHPETITILKQVTSSSFGQFFSLFSNFVESVFRQFIFQNMLNRAQKIRAWRAAVFLIFILDCNDAAFYISFFSSEFQIKGRTFQKLAAWKIDLIKGYAHL